LDVAFLVLCSIGRILSVPFNALLKKFASTYANYTWQVVLNCDTPQGFCTWFAPIYVYKTPFDLEPRLTTFKVIFTIPTQLIIRYITIPTI